MHLLIHFLLAIIENLSEQVIMMKHKFNSTNSNFKEGRKLNTDTYD